MKKTLSIIMAAVLLLTMGSAFAVELPIVAEPTTFVVAVGTSGYCLIPWAEKPFYQAITAETNIVFEWQELDDWSTQTNLQIASGDTPDIYMGGLNVTTFNENLDMFHELTDLINANAPTLLKAFEEEPALLASIKSSDGGIYKLPNQYSFNLDNAIGTQYWINQNWLDAVNLENPTNIEELEAVLVAFRDLDPNGNGEADEIPFSMQETGWAGKFSSLFGTYGVLYDTANYVDCDDEGKVYFQASQEAFYDALVWINGMAADGLIDKESFSQSGDQLSTKISQNVLGIVAKYNPQNFLDGFVPMHVIVGPNEKTLYEGTNDSAVGNNVTIPATCENPEAIVKLWEYINSDFTKKLSNRYGEEGVYWEYTGSGNNYVLHDYDSVPPEGYEFWDQYVYTMGETGSAGFSFFTKADLANNVSPKTVRETGIIEYQPYFPAVEYHAAALEGDLASEKNMLYVELDAYVQTFVSNAIFGEINEDVWNTHLEALQKLDVDRYVELCQMSYDAYCELLK